MRDKRPEPRYLAVGRIARPHGVLGELRMELLTDYPERLIRHKTVYVGPEHRPYRPVGLRLHQGAALLKLDGCDDRNAAELFRVAKVEEVFRNPVPLKKEPLT